MGNGDTDAEVEADLIEGQITTQLSGSLTDLTLHHWRARWGHFSLLGEAEYTLRFPTPVSPLQAGLSVEFLNLTLPRLGPFIVEAAAEGALDYVHGEGFELSPSLRGDIALARVPWLHFSLETSLNLSFDRHSRAVSVEPLGPPTLTITLDILDLVRRAGL